ncbi:MAG TPA: GNAT family N-acetyltransferase [Victivallales bacterium]|nr:GNAT family N-acetyltransferase [Victivallales bacterium]
MKKIKSKLQNLKNGKEILIREAKEEDANEILNYIETISRESDFLTFGPGEFGISEIEEKEFLNNCAESENLLYLVGVINDKIVSSLSFSAGSRPRIRHVGEFGVSVRKEYWNLGIGTLMLDMLIDWIKANQIINKINLSVRTDNNHAIALYKNKGFIIEGTMSNDVFINGTYFDNHCMGLTL